MTVHALHSSVRRVETVKDVLDNIDCATMALRSLHARVSESNDTAMANDADAVLGLYICYVDTLIAKGNELVAAADEAA